MSYEGRILPPEEWGRLAGGGIEALRPVLKPETCRIAVVEAAGAIVGHWTALPMIHLEGVYIALEHRGKAAVARRLLAVGRAMVRSLGATAFLTAAETDEVRRLLAHLGAEPLPDHFLVRL